MVELFVFMALISISLFAISSIISKYIIPTIGGPYRFLLVEMVIGLFFLILFFIYEVINGFDLNKVNNSNILLLITLNAIFTFFGYLCLMIGLSKGNASVGGIVLSSRVFASIPIAFIVIGEKYPVGTYIFIIASLVGAISASWEAGMHFSDLIKLRSPGMRYFVVTAICWGVANVFIRKLGTELPPFIFLTLRQIIMTIIAISLFKYGGKHFENEIIVLNKKILSHVLVYVLILLMAQWLFVYSLGRSLTISEGIGVAEGALTFLFSIIFAKFIDNSVLNEPLDKNSLLVRVSGTIIAGIGTVGIIFFSTGI